MFGFLYIEKGKYIKKTDDYEIEKKSLKSEEERLAPLRNKENTKNTFIVTKIPLQRDIIKGIKFSTFERPCFGNRLSNFVRPSEILQVES